MRLALLNICSVALLVASACLIGCSSRTEPDYDSLNLAEVTGTVTLDGQPLSDATVLFERKSENRALLGLTDESGNYRIAYNTDIDGALPGEWTVRVIPGQQSEGGDTGEEQFEEGGDTPPGEGADPDATPSSVGTWRFPDGETTTMFTVQPNAAHDFDIELTSS